MLGPLEAALPTFSCVLSYQASISLEKLSPRSPLLPAAASFKLLLLLLSPAAAAVRAVLGLGAVGRLGDSVMAAAAAGGGGGGWRLLPPPPEPPLAVELRGEHSEPLLPRSPALDLRYFVLYL